MISNPEYFEDLNPAKFTKMVRDGFFELSCVVIVVLMFILFVRRLVSVSNFGL